MKILKYPLGLGDRKAVAVALPKGAELLTVQIQHGLPHLWALVDESAEFERRTILLRGDDHPTDRLGKYLGTCQLDGGNFVLHAFEEPGVDPTPYRERGYDDREDYLRGLAEDYGLDLEQVVRPLADLYGPDEDFDGLVSSLEDESL